MKKTVIMLLLAALAITGMATPLAFAEEAQVDLTELSSHLVVHYDFEGENVGDALIDKSNGGSVKDNLIAYTPNNKNTAPSTDTVTPTAVDDTSFASSFVIDPVKGTAKNLVASATLQAKSSADVRSLYSRDEQNNVGAATWFVRFKIDDVDLAETRLVDMRVNNSGGRMFSILVNTNGQLITNAARTASKNNTYIYTTAESGKVTDGMYVNFVLVMETGTGTSGYTTDVKYTPYVSYGTPTKAGDWVALTGTDFVSFRTDRLSDAPLSLFDRYDGAGSNNSSLTYDDVRLYNKALTVDEMQAMFAAGSFDTESSTEETSGEQTTSEETTTQEAPTTEAPTTATSVTEAPANTNEVTEPQQNVTEKVTASDETDAKTDAMTDVSVQKEEGCKASVLTVSALAFILLPAAAVFVSKKKK